MEGDGMREPRTRLETARQGIFFSSSPRRFKRLIGGMGDVAPLCLRQATMRQRAALVRFVSRRLEIEESGPFAVSAAYMKRERELSLPSPLLPAFTAWGQQKNSFGAPFSLSADTLPMRISARFHRHLFICGRGSTSPLAVTLASLAPAALVNQCSEVSSILVWVATILQHDGAQSRNW